MNLSNDYQCEGQLSIFDVYNQDTLFGKMSAGHSNQTGATISEPFSKKLSMSSNQMPMFLDLRTDGHPQGASWQLGGGGLAGS